MNKFLALALALFITAGAVMAEDAKPVAAPAAAAVDVKAFDTDKNGALSKDEIAAIKDEAAKVAVVALDADMNGEVSVEEAAPKKDAPANVPAANVPAAK